MTDSSSSTRALWKSALLLLGTFVLGGLLGGLLVGTVVQNRVDTIRSLRTADGFVERTIDLLEPTDAAQRDTLRPLLREAGEDIEHITDRARTDLRATLDTLWRSVQPHLTPDQRARLDAMRQRFRSRLSDQAAARLNQRAAHPRAFTKASSSSGM